MAEEFSLDQAKDILEGGLGEAQAIINDPSKISDLLGQIEAKAKDLPATVGGALANVPLMAQMVKSYVTKEYTEVSPKVVLSLVSAFLYFVKKKDLIDDSIPLLGYADDLAVFTIALKLSEPELEAFKTWKDGQPAEA